MYILLLCLISILSATATTYTAVTDGSEDEFRYLAVNQDSSTNSITVSGSKLKVDPNTNKITGTAQLDAAGFKIQALGASQSIISDHEPVVGFSLLSANASYSFNPSNGVLSTAGTVAWAEVVAGFTHIFTFKDRNGVPGFQYTLGDPVFDCSINNGYDCIIAGSPIDLKADLSWSTIVIGQTACPTGYNANCTIYTFTTTGTDSFGNTVMTLVQTIANQKIIITSNGHEVGPDYAKLDFTITYPWAAKNLTGTQSSASIGLALYAGGTAGSTTFVGYFQNRKALVFSGSNGKSAIFGWDPTADLDGVSTNVVMVTISGDEILNYNCPLLCNPIIVGWKLAAGVVKAIGWSSEIMFLSAPGAGVTTWAYDPTFGATDNSQITNTGNTGSFLAPHMFVSFLCFFVLYAFRRY